METKILVVDDELSMREFLTILLEREGYLVISAASADAALTQLEFNFFDLVISDVKMPGLSGIELLRRIKLNSPDTAVLMITAFSEAEQAVEAMKLGAYDYIAKPFKIEEVKQLVKNALEKYDLKRENRTLRQQATARENFHGIIGTSARIKEIIALIRKVAPSGSSVMILGESGTGKELTARAIHSNSPRSGKAFVAVNCGAIPEALIESELFGHKKGAFTGAIADRPGLFEQAEGGTLFLDEIGELPLSLQTKLLRVLQEREFRRVGDAAVRKADVRILTASNSNLNSRIKDGGFREDLFYRINVVQIMMPPLRERIEDIPLMIASFYRRLSNVEPSGEIITPAALKILMNYHFPGNIRELENIVERSLILDSSVIDETSLPIQLFGGKQSLPTAEIDIPEEGMALEPVLEDLEKQYLLKALERTFGAKKKAAELLGMSFRSFRYRLAKFGLDTDE